MEKIIVKCPAKINLFLNIIGIDNRKYHLMHMLNQSVSLYDYLYIKKTTSSIKITCNNPEIPTNEKNSVFKAAKLFLEYTKINTGLEIHIIKNIPTMAGLGGESTDAAGIIYALNYIFNTNLTAEELNILSYKTSCDVPFCLVGGSCEVKGCGEIIKKWSNPYKYYIILNPNIKHSTQEMFTLFDKLVNYNYKTVTPQIGYNDFHIILENNIKELINIIKTTYAINAMLTGSGSSIIGIYKNEITQEKAYNKLKDIFKNNYTITKVQAVNGLELIKDESKLIS